MRAQNEKGWWGRNWGWFVPSACLGCLILPVACVGGCLWLGVSQLDSFGPFEEVIAAANRHPKVEERLGAPIKMDWRGFSDGMNATVDERRAEMTLKVKGTRGRGILRVVAHRRNGIWEYNVAELQVHDPDESIDLRDQIVLLRNEE